MDKRNNDAISPRDDIRARIKEVGLNQTSFAKEVELSKQMVSNILSGHRGMAAENVMKFAKVLRWTAEQVLGESTTEPATIPINFIYGNGEIMPNTKEEFAKTPPTLKPDGLTAIRITETINPTIRAGYIAYYRELTWGTNPADKLCIVSVKGVVTIAEVELSLESGKFNINPIKGKPIKNTPIDFIGEIIAWVKEEV